MHASGTAIAIVVGTDQVDTFGARAWRLALRPQESKMNKFLIPAAALTLVVLAASSPALAQKPTGPSVAGAVLEEVTVTATRINVKATVSKVGWPHTPVKQVTLSYVISTAEFDLATTAGAAALEKEVNDAAMDVCKEIGRQYPGSTPDDAGCAKAASAKAMVRVRELIAAAAKQKAP
jgi:UrcA family protein